MARDVSNGLSALYSNGVVCVEAGSRYAPECPIPLAELAMLLKFYAPELQHHHENFITLRDQMSGAVADLISGRAPKEKAEKQALNERLIKASFKATEIGEALIQEASTVGRGWLGASA